MKRTTTIEMKEGEHGLFGLGTATYTYTESGGKFYLKLTVKDMLVEWAGHEARKVYHKLNRDTLLVTITACKRLACEATGIKTAELGKSTRERPFIFARAAVYNYLIKELGFSLGQAIDEVGGPSNHSTALNAIKLYGKEDKELSVDEREWKRTFIKSLKENEL